MLCGVGIWRWEEDFCVVTKLSRFTAEWLRHPFPLVVPRGDERLPGPPGGIFHGFSLIPHLSSPNSSHLPPLLPVPLLCPGLVLFPIQVVHVLVCAKSLQSHLTLCNPVDHSPPGSSVRGNLQARILEWIAVPSFRRSSQPRDQTYVFYTPTALAGQFFTTSTTGEAQYWTYQYFNILESTVVPFDSDFKYMLTKQSRRS